MPFAAGFVIRRRPGAGAEALTAFAALLFLVGGLFRLAGGREGSRRRPGTVAQLTLSYAGGQKVCD